MSHSLATLNIDRMRRWFIKNNHEESEYEKLFYELGDMGWKGMT